MSENYISELSLFKNSELSVGTSSVDNNNDQQGGFFWSSSGCTDNDKKVLKAAKDHKFEAFSYMILNNMINNLKSRDEDGCTILHHLAWNWGLHPDIDKALDKVLCQSNIGSIINLQDNLGDTPLHKAVKKQNHILAQKLVKAGADKNIENNTGIAIESETDELSINIISPINKMEFSDNNSTFKNIVKLFLGDKKPTKEENYTFDSPGERFTINNTDKKITGGSPQMGKEEDTEQFLNMIMNKYSHAINAQQGGADSDAYTENTDVFLTRVMNDYINEQPQKGGSINNADSFFRKLVESTEHCEMNQLGGYSNYRTGSRKLKLYEGNVELSESASMNNYYSSAYDEPDDFEFSEPHSRRMSRHAELSRLINNQASEIHQRALKKIVDLMGVDEEIARNYKALMWRKVKEDNPDLKSNLDLSVELEKAIKKTVLKKMDPEEGKALREESRKRRQEMNKNKKPRKPRQKKEQSSEAPLADAGDFSATSTAMPEDIENSFSATSLSRTAQYDEDEDYEDYYDKYSATSEFN